MKLLLLNTRLWVILRVKEKFLPLSTFMNSQLPYIYDSYIVILWHFLQITITLRFQVKCENTGRANSTRKATCSFAGNSLLWNKYVFQVSLILRSCWLIRTVQGLLLSHSCCLLQICIDWSVYCVMFKRLLRIGRHVANHFCGTGKEVCHSQTRNYLTGFMGL